VLSETDPYDRILGFLNLSHYFFFQVAPQAEWTPFQTHCFPENLEVPRIEPGPLDIYVLLPLDHRGGTSHHRRSYNFLFTSKHSPLVEEEAGRFVGRLGHWFRMLPLQVTKTEHTSAELEVAPRAMTCAPTIKDKDQYGLVLLVEERAQS
jgi:hypothetical protein